ncbi:cysteine desulfurase CsdA [Budvicia aquatica]|uniref:cysteine desulfurase n=1 Tax=Budvicia aquatica TaxID=82979 RepID=A0A2C6CZH2_9GAMM|nr:cysteine desulfurase CsdA [Budvicia aquatica]MBP9643753.1 cysteine desulfurase CsdA [Budvicia sp.]PHI32089.1 cysteine desulfurase CsdA [Budvicia aquatica]GKX52648.1 cysteine sulfinate desulfinase [Budvicia aquatica]VFS53440.1 Cysteine sulfinate desulfinase [Budvicia aquatica]
MKSFDPTAFRHQFPALHQAGCYLDSAATALKPLTLVQATGEYYAHNGATVHRSAHSAAQNATDRFESARESVRELINAASHQQIVWTKGTTEAINLVAQSYARPRLKAGDEILVSESEHHSNLIPWLMVAQQTGATVIKLPLDQRYLPDLTQLEQLLTGKTKILAIGHMSNVTGGCPDLKLAIELAHKNGTIVVVDGAQGVVHSPPDVQQLDVDFYAFSAHKLYGPTGIGVLYGKSTLLAEMAPWQGGGKMLTQASFDGFEAQSVPECFEAGTPNIAGVIGFGATLSWLNTQDIVQAEHYACSLAQLAYEKLATIPGFISYRAQNSSLLAFNIAGFHHSDIATLLSEQGVAIRSGQHCAQPLLDAIGVSGTLRASFAPYNQPDDVDKLYQSLIRALSLLE